METNRTDKERLSAAFKVLRKKGYVCHSNFMCCGSCASYAINSRLTELGVPEEGRKMVFYNRQSNDAFKTYNGGPGVGRRGGELTHDLYSTLYLSWSGDAEEIMAALHSEGLLVAHDGSEAQCIQVHPRGARGQM